MSKLETDLQSRLHEEAGLLFASGLGSEDLAGIKARGTQQRVRRTGGIALLAALPIVAAGTVWAVSPFGSDDTRIAPSTGPSGTQSIEVNAAEVERCQASPRSSGQLTRIAGSPGTGPDAVAVAERLVRGDDEPGGLGMVPGGEDGDVPLLASESEDMAVVAVYHSTGVLAAVFELNRAQSDGNWYVDTISGC